MDGRHRRLAVAFCALDASPCVHSVYGVRTERARGNDILCSSSSHFVMALYQHQQPHTSTDDSPPNGKQQALKRTVAGTVQDQA